MHCFNYHIYLKYIVFAIKFQRTHCKTCVLTYQMRQTDIKLQKEQYLIQERDTCNFGPIFCFLELQPEGENLFFKTLYSGVKKACFMLSCLPEILFHVHQLAIFSHTRCFVYNAVFMHCRSNLCSTKQMPKAKLLWDVGIYVQNQIPVRVFSVDI